jgi:bacterioferritin
LTGELTAINQYFLHARICDNWGYKRLGKKIYEESIDEMRHAQTLIDRILFLDGLPNLQKLGALNIGETVAEQFKADLDLELQAQDKLQRAIASCMQENDHVSRRMLEDILASEQEHIDWLEAQLQLISQMGLQNYLSQQMHPS